MANQRTSRRSSDTTAVFVRIVAFFVAVLAIVTIPTALIEVTRGGIALNTGVIAVTGAAALILTAIFAARRVDPLRG